MVIWRAALPGEASGPRPAAWSWAAIEIRFHPWQVRWHHEKKIKVVVVRVKGKRRVDMEDETEVDRKGNGLCRVVK